jgi:hypothetical protein
MKSSEILLTLEHADLLVWTVGKGTYCVKYDHSDVKDGDVLVGTFGRGTDFETACEDYLNKIRGKTLVFNNFGKNKEVTVLG